MALDCHSPGCRGSAPCHPTLAGHRLPIPQPWGIPPASLPRWRLFLLGACNTARLLGAPLNWRRNPDYERRRRLIEQRTKEIENEIELIKKDSEQIRKDTERLKRENAKLKLLNARTRHLISYVDQHYFPPKYNSTLPQPTELDCEPSSP